MDALENRFAEIKAPIVFVYGERDPFGVDQHAKKLSDELPHVKTIVVPDAGHMLPVVHPEAVVEAIGWVGEALLHFNEKGKFDFRAAR